MAQPISTIVFHTGSKENACILWEGYLQGDDYTFCKHYFDDVSEYTNWLLKAKISHTGNVSIVSPKEYDEAYMLYLKLTCL